MAYQDELLAQALALIQAAPPNQASLRRSVSTAYYAVFHLLIAEATANWSQAELRAVLGRAFDHGPMKQASNRVASVQQSPYVGEDPEIVAGLRLVAKTFWQLQENRHFADYDLTSELDAAGAFDAVKSAEKVFEIWPRLRSHRIAQEYLVSLLVRR